jgi:hypothetical protein
MANVNYSKYVLLTGCINMLMYVLVHPTFLIYFPCETRHKEIIKLSPEFLHSSTKPKWGKHKTTDG